jgi:polysaccharide biosynthesis protein PslH
MKILWVKSGPLFPADTGGKIRTLNMLRELSALHEVTYLSLLPSSVPLHPDEEPDRYAQHKIWIPFADYPRRSTRFFIQLFFGMVSSKPFALSKHYSSELRQRLIELDEAGNFDLIICDFLASALHFVGRDWVTPTVLFQHNMEAQIWQRIAANQKGLISRWFMGLQHRRMLRWEVALSGLFDGVVTVSPEDTRIARDSYGLRNVLGDVPPGVDTHYFQPTSNSTAKTPPILAFLGSMDWMPNVEGLLWFVAKVYPLVKAAHPSVRLRVVGRRPGHEILNLAVADSSIEVTGTVEDVRPCLLDARALVVPLLAGGGTRIKILEAMAMGLPVVSTTIGAEGLPFENGRHLLLADTPQEIANACSALLLDPTLADQVSQAARVAVVERYSWAAASRRFMDLAEKAI